MSNKYIEPGMICALDPNNDLGQDIAGCTQVEIIGLASKKNQIFGKDNIWICKNVEIDAQEVEIPERYLIPVAMVIVRNPPDMPTINDMDIEELTKVINLFSNLIPPDGYGINGTTVQRLAALREKLVFYEKMRHV